MRGSTRLGVVGLAVSSLTVAAALTGGALASAAAARPGAPLHLTTVIGNTSVKLSWTNSIASAKSPVTEYVATDKPAGKTCTLKANKTGKYTCSFTGLKASATYKFAVHAVATKVVGKTAVTPVTMGPSATQAWKVSSDLVPAAGLFNDTYLDAASTGVDSATNNQVQVTEYPSNTLYSSQTLAFTALEQDQIQAVVTQALNVNSLIPAFDGTQIAYIAPTSPQYFQIYAPGTPWFAEAAAECAKVGVTLVPIAGASAGEAGFGSTSTTPFTSLGSLSGLKVRVAGAGIVTNELTTLGAQTVNLSTTETATGLQSGTVTAALGSAAFLSTTTKGIIHGFFDPGTFQYGPYFMFVNTKAWDAIGTKDQNEIIAGVGGPVDTYIKSINLQQEVNDETLASQGDWVVKATPAQITQYAKLLQPAALASFKTEDLASYNALAATVKGLGLPWNGN
jgi:TRAP-type C4-dicarboxylate transport system substrate-binding protein